MLFLDDQTLAELHQTLRDARPFVEQFSQAANLNSLFRLVNHQFRTARKEQNAENESLVKAIPALKRIVDQAADSLKRSGTPLRRGSRRCLTPGRKRKSSNASPLRKDGFTWSMPAPARKH